MATIKDISKFAGVSSATVSRVLNGFPHVSKKNKTAVLNAIEVLNYVPSSSAVNLRQGKTNLIGVFLPTLEPPYNLLLQNISETLIKFNYNIVLLLQNSKNYNLDILKSKKFDGSIIAFPFEDHEIIKEYTSYGPIVLCNNVPHCKIPSIYIDYFHMGYESVIYLFKKGFKKTTVFLRDMEIINQKKFMKGYLQGIEDFNLETDKNSLFLNNEDELVEHISKYSTDALIIDNDELILKILNANNDPENHFINKPSVLKLGDSSLANFFNISVIKENIEEIGMRSAELILEHHNDDMNLELSKKRFFFEIIDRNENTN